MKIITKNILLSTLITLPFLGFVTGFIICSDCGWNVFGRIFIGIIYMFLTPITFGIIPLDESGGNFLNIQLYIPIVWILVFIFLYCRSKK